MAKEWASFGSGQFMQQATSPQQHLSGGLPQPPLPHLPLPPYSPLHALQYSDRDRQLSPSFLLHGKPLPLACSPSPTQSPNHQLLAERVCVQSPSSPYLRQHPSRYTSPNSSNEQKFGGLGADQHRLGFPTPSLNRSFGHSSPSGSNNASPLPIQPMPLFRSGSNSSLYSESEKSRQTISSQDVQERLRYLAQQRTWKKDSVTQPEASLRMGFGASPQPAKTETNGQYGGTGGQSGNSLQATPGYNHPAGGQNLKSPVVDGTSDTCPVIPGSGNSTMLHQYSPRQLMSSGKLGSLEQSFSAQEKPVDTQATTPKALVQHPQGSSVGRFINGYDSHNMESSAKGKRTEGMTHSGSPSVPLRTPPSYHQNGVAFAKSSAPTLQNKKNSDSPRKYPDVLSREREHQILADIQKRFSLPNGPSSEDSSKAAIVGQTTVRSPDHQNVQQQLLQQKALVDKPKVKKKRKKKLEHPVNHSSEENSHDCVKTHVTVDPMFEKYPVYSKIMASFIEASNKSGLNSAYSCLKKTSPGVCDGEEVSSPLKKKKKKKKVDISGCESTVGSDKSSACPGTALTVKEPEFERTSSDNVLPSIAGFTCLQRDSGQQTNNKLHVSQYSNIPGSVALSQKESRVGYNVDTYNTVLSKLQDQVKRLSYKVQGCGASVGATTQAGHKAYVSEMESRSLANGCSNTQKNLVSGLPSIGAFSGRNLPPSSQSTIGGLVVSAGDEHYDLQKRRLFQEAGSAEHIESARNSVDYKLSSELSDSQDSNTLAEMTKVDRFKETSMCCDTCHKVGKQDSYLCSSNKVLLNDSSVKPSCDKPNCTLPSTLEELSRNSMSQTHNTGSDVRLCDSSIPSVGEALGTGGSYLCPQTGQLTYSNHVVKTTDAVDVEFKPDEQDRLDRLKSNMKIEIPACDCLGPDYQYSEATEGPFYTHLGAASSLVAIRHIMEERFELKGNAIRIEKVRYTGKEGKSSQGCPIAKWILRRSGPEEKAMCIVKHRSGHRCPSAYIIVAIVAWEGVPQTMADEMYDYMIRTVTTNGFETDRRCGTNEAKTCACQGWDLDQRGASFSFGCSWSMYFNGCKFARSREAKKFKLKDTSQEEVLEEHFQSLATLVAPLYRKSAPESYNNQVAFESQGQECRLGKNPGRPFSGVTTCMDFCAHAHKDLHNMNNGCTVVVTLTKHRGFDKPDDEQLHVLPLYVLDSTDEFGSEEGLYQKVRTGCLEVLTNYPMEARIRAYPLTPKKRGKGKKESPIKKDAQKSEMGPLHLLKTLKENDPYSDKRLQYQMMQQLQSQRHQQLQGQMLGKLAEQQHHKHSALPENSGTGLQMPNPAPSDRNAQIAPGAPQKGQPLYDAFWNYFEKFGTFPPQEFSQPVSHLPPSQQPRGVPCQMEAIKTEGVNSSSQGTIPPTNGLPHAKFHNNTGPDYKAVNFSADINSSHRPNGAFSVGGTPGSFTSCAQITSRDAPKPESDPGYPGVSQAKNPMLMNQSQHLPNSHQENQRYNPQHSALHLLSEAVSIRSKDIEDEMSSISGQVRDSAGFWPCPNIKKELASPPMVMSQDIAAKSGAFHTSHPVKQDMNFNFGGESRPDCVDGCMRDSNFLSAEMEYNEDSFLDPEIGGVAVALTHGSVYFEVAKRELHATTALRRPNRKNPTRISMVFYQHKNMNLRHHGWYENERKAELMRQRRLERMKEGASNAEDTPSKPGPKKKKKKSEEVDFAKTSAAKYKYMWEAPVGQAETMTTDSIIVRWIDSQPMVTGPYQRWVSH